MVRKFTKNKDKHLPKLQYVTCDVFSRLFSPFSAKCCNMDDCFCKILASTYGLGPYEVFNRLLSNYFCNFDQFKTML